MFIVQNSYRAGAKLTRLADAPQSQGYQYHNGSLATTRESQLTSPSQNRNITVCCRTDTPAASIECTFGHKAEQVRHAEPHAI
jgi:hypothetical protein